MTVREFLPQYMAYKSKTCKLSTVSAYRMIIKTHIEPILGNHELSQITNKEAELLKETCLQKGLSRKSISDIIITLKNILNIADYLEVAKTNKVKVVWPTVNDQDRCKIQVYNKEQVKKLVSYLEDNPSFRNLGIMLVIYSGIRIGEVCALQWKNVNLDQKTFSIKATLQRVYIEGDDGIAHTEVIETTPKSISSQRDIPLIPKMYKLMKAYSNIMKPDYYVCSGEAKPMEPRRLRQYYTQLIQDLGLPKLKFHGLRHTFATQMLSAKSDVKVLSSILGHSSISITMDVYVHPSQDDKRKAMTKLSF